MKKIPFCHLHVHSSYSLLDSTIKIKELISTAKKMEMEHVALTDHAVLFGAVEFYNEAISSGIKPIIGCDVYVAKHGIEHRKTQRDNMSLVLLAENQIGYENLVKLVSKAHLEGMYYKPRIDKSILKPYSEGLIALSGDLHGEVNAACREDNLEEAERLIDEYISIFGKDNFFLELTDHGTKNNDDYKTDEKWVKISQDQKKVNQHLCNLSKKMSVQLVVTNDVHYILKEHAEAHDILTCLQRGMLVADPNRYRYLGNQLYFKTGKEMLEQFPDYKEAIENTVKIAERCNVAFSLSSAENPKKAEDLHFPTFPIPVNYKSNTDYLIYLAKKGIKDLYGIEDIDNP
ncbi:MAG: PHP domain-containing protein, partial [Verrucomicrobiota bacterium]|nr:PHP domain-containing protein [Verrucomicrobiota bacterium]